MMKSETNLFSKLDHSISMDIQTINHLIENLPPPTVVDEDQDHFFHQIEDDGGQRFTYDELGNIHTLVNHLLENENLDDLVDQMYGGEYRMLDFEILAYYVPFHFHNRPNHWGIHLRTVGIAHVRQKLLQFAYDDQYEEQMFGNDLQIPTNVAVNVLLLHELKHHAIEVACTRFELQNTVPGHYYSYIRQKQRRRRIHYDTEAICNANILRQKPKLKTDFSFPGQLLLPNQSCSLDWTAYVTRFMNGQPPGYRDFRHFRTVDYMQLQHMLGFDRTNVAQNVLRINSTDIMKEFRSHSGFSTLKRLPVPIHLH